jgi:hypothetical protein
MRIRGVCPQGSRTKKTPKEKIQNERSTLSSSTPALTIWVFCNTTVIENSKQVRGLCLLTSTLKQAKILLIAFEERSDLFKKFQGFS